VNVIWKERVWILAIRRIRIAEVADVMARPNDVAVDELHQAIVWKAEIGGRRRILEDAMLIILDPENADKLSVLAGGVGAEVRPLLGR
jgi:hypothetical protein